MKKPVLTALFVLLAALPLAAQTSEFGLLFGGSRAMGLPSEDPANPVQTKSGINDFHFGGSVKEVYFGTRVDPETVFRVKAGTADVALVYPTTVKDADGKFIRASARGTVEHIEAIADYRFSEPFGSTGIFAGLGMYRAKVNQGTETNGGLTAGLNAGIPINRRIGLMFEGSYHWVRTDVRQRFVTLTGGLRMNF